MLSPVLTVLLEASKAKPGYVYFVQSGYFCKIGTTKNMKTRMSLIQTNTPYQLEVRLVLRGDKGVEAFLHCYFSHFRYRGEWFFMEGLDAYINSSFLRQYACKDYKYVF